MEPLHVEVVDTPQGTILRLRGDMGIHLAAVDVEINGIAARRPKLTVVDLSAVTVMSSLAMGLLVGLRHGLELHDCTLKLAAPSQLVLDSLRRTGLTKLFEICDSVAVAF